MKKIWQWLTGSVIKEVGEVLDNLTTTKEEKLEAQRLITEILEKADKEAQEQVTARWQADMASDSMLSKNIRPLVLIYLTVIFTVCAFFDGNIGEFSIAEEYIPIFQTLLVTVYGAYFVGRSWEKAKSMQSK
jgi:ABC-type multidrug transport system fused ATPase/permease subunit